MKKSDYLNGMIKYILKRDEHLALNKVQVEQLVHYINIYNNNVGILLPEALPLTKKEWEIKREEYIKDRFKWEPEQEQPEYIVGGDGMYKVENE